jgi:hypothetical protein
VVKRASLDHDLAVDQQSWMCEWVRGSEVLGELHVVGELRSAFRAGQSLRGTGRFAAAFVEAVLDGLPNEIECRQLLLQRWHLAGEAYDRRCVHTRLLG